MHPNHPDQQIEAMGPLTDSAHLDRRTRLADSEAAKLVGDQLLILDLQALSGGAPLRGVQALSPLSLFRKQLSDFEHGR